MLGFDWIFLSGASMAVTFFCFNKTSEFISANLQRHLEKPSNVTKLIRVNEVNKSYVRILGIK